MSDHPENRERRRFLSLLGTGSALGSMLIGAPATAGELLGGERDARRPREAAATVGILLPDSRLCPQLSSSFQAGLALALAQHPQLGITPLIGRLGVAGHGLYQHLGDLLAQQAPALVVGFLDARLAEAATKRCQGKALYLDCSMGAIVPHDPATSQAHLRCTLAHWQSQYALGRWAADQGKRAVMVSTLYDAGYDGLYAFQLGFEAGGGSLAPTIVLDAPGRELTTGAALIQAAGATPDIVYAALHDHRAGPFLADWAGSPLAGRALLVGNELMLDHAADHAAAPPLAELAVCSSYDPALANAANQSFREQLRAAGARPDRFAVLGFEAGQLIATAFRGSSRGGGPDQLATTLAGATLESPRGTVRLDPRTGSAVAPHYLSVCTRGAVGVERRIVAELPTIDPQDERIVAWQRNLRSGWENPYLSV